MEFATKLFDVTDFPPRWYCGEWTETHGWLHIYSDLAIWAAYFAIPCILGFFLLNKQDLPFRRVFLLFGAFILFCGATHLMEAIIFWWPGYRLAGVIKLLTAIVSWSTVAALVPIVPKVLAMRSPEELEREIVARKKAEEAILQANVELERRVLERTADLASANAALHREREWLRTTLASIGDGVITTDIKGHITSLNPVAVSLTGWPQHAAFGVPLEKVFRIINEFTREPIENPAMRALASGKIVSLANHTILLTRDGAERFIDDSAAPIKGENGETIGAVLIFRDISERYQVERDRQALAARLKTLIQNAPIGIALFDSDLRFIELNEQAAAIYGLPRESHIGKTAAELMPEMGSAIDAYLQRVRDTGESAFNVEIKGQTPASRNEMRYWLASYFPVRDNGNNLLGIGAVGLEITEQKVAAELLRQSEARFTQLADAIPQLAWMAHPDGHIDWYNSRWYEYTGATFEQMQGWGWQRVHDPEVLSHVMEKWTHCLATGEPFDMVFPLRGADGQFRPFLTRVMPFRDANHAIVRWFGTNTDISEQTRTQEELRHLAARLSEADRRKDEFLATLAHELRNPLAPIRTGLEVMKLAKHDPATLEEIRATMERQTKQLITLVDDLLDVSRITRGRLELRKLRVKLDDAINSAVEASRPLMDEAGHRLTVSLPQQPIFLYADPNRLAQVISNLLNNAAKYTPDVGRIDLTVILETDHVLLSVKDTGIGIPADMLDRIFEMFAQIERPIEKSYTGLGIGLTLVKSLVEMHDGTIQVRSDGPQKGSEFVVRLPIIVESPAGEAQRGLPGAIEVSAEATALSRRVLVVDDNKAAADMLGLVVKMLGNEVRIAGDGQEAIQIASEFLPDFILMDLGMPRMNGYEAARHIRRQSWGKVMVLIALTGWGQDEDKKRTQQAGFDHHLVKPADPAELQRLFATLQRTL